MITNEQILPNGLLPDNSPFFTCTGGKPLDLAFFDIETTGFKPSATSVYLIGVVIRVGEQWKSIRWMCERSSEEILLLRIFSEFIRPYKTLVHFNGNRFDIPYLTEKYEKYDLPIPFGEKRSIDIYQDLRTYKSLWELSNINQKSLERFSNLYREDPFTGGELIEKYRQFRKSGDKELEEMLMLHNGEDLAGMLHILSLYCYPLLHRMCSSGFSNVTVIDTPCSSASYFVLRADLPFTVPAPFEKRHPLYEHCKISLLGNECRLYVPVVIGDMKFFFEHPKEYYYLPLEDMAIHKSVASFVGKEFRRPATRETCYVKRAGTFVPCCQIQDQKVYRTCCSSKETWRELPSDFSENTKEQTILYDDLMQSFFD